MAKQYQIPKQTVLDAFKAVRKNQGSAGIDGQDLKAFEGNLKSELYKIWNRMSSGSYFPPPVRAVPIAKKQGGCRILGIPTVSDRVAQTVVKMYLEPEMEKHFHPSSFGYRPNKSAHQALAQARQNCWKYHWTIDLDILGFFDDLDHALVMKAVKCHTQEKWILALIDRWLKAPIQEADGSSQRRTKGTPQGGVISPLLANLFLHYAFDKWMEKNFPDVPFERYADDIIVHCRTGKQAKYLLLQIAGRMKRCKLELHPSKTKIVKGWSSDPEDRKDLGQFDFLGHTFRLRKAVNQKGQYFSNLLPAVSRKACLQIRETIRSWKLHLKSGSTIEQLALEINPIVRGWIEYYGKFYKSELRKPLKQIEDALTRWACRKYKTLKGRPTRAGRFLGFLAQKRPRLFAHWLFGVRSYAE